MITVHASGRTDPGRERANNEDAFAITDLTTGTVLTAGAEGAYEASNGAVLLAVSDGMGGASAGEVASSITIETLRTALAAGLAGGQTENLLRTSIVEANRKVQEAARQPGRDGMGATLTAVVVQDDRAFVAEVGDSRAYLLRSGRIAQVTRDQSYVQLLMDSGALTAEQARDFPQKNIILQAVGVDPAVRPALGTFQLRRGDRLILCSDGLSNELSDEELRQLGSAEGALPVLCEKLVRAANEHGGKDNVTVVLATFDGDGLEEPERGSIHV